MEEVYTTLRGILQKHTTTSCVKEYDKVWQDISEYPPHDKLGCICGNFQRIMSQHLTKRK